MRGGFGIKKRGAVAGVPLSNAISGGDVDKFGSSSGDKVGIDLEIWVDEHEIAPFGSAVGGIIFSFDVG